ncbi:MAG: 3'(2'),5'-bisphosphate nucleotidase CysQ [Halioglobus sp.]
MPLLDLCDSAGNAILSHYASAQAGEFEAKHDDSPLTRADTDSHIILDAGLIALAPQWPVLSEESPTEIAAMRRSWPTYWLVDPLDGTKEFLGRTGEFTINIALIQNHVPVFGMLYIPLEHRACVGIPGGGASTWSKDAAGRWSSESLVTRKLVPGKAMTVLASRRHRNQQLQQCLSWLEMNWGEQERENSGSALKFCHLAQGEGDFYPRFSPCSEWDVAAGQAIVEAAGGAVLGLDGHPLRYNCRDSLLSQHFLAIGDPEQPLWGNLMNFLEE